MKRITNKYTGGLVKKENSYLVNQAGEWKFTNILTIFPEIFFYVSLKGMQFMKNGLREFDPRLIQIFL